MTKAFIESLRTLSLTLTVTFVFFGRAMSQDPAAHQTVVPLHEFQQGQWNLCVKFMRQTGLVL